jgi:hypothetical protein
LTVKENGETQDELMLAIQVELDEIVSKEVCDTVYESASHSLQRKSQAELDAECKVRKGAIMNVVSSSVCLQRLYFIIRSSIMGAITGLLTYLIISIFFNNKFFLLGGIGVVYFCRFSATFKISGCPNNKDIQFNPKIFR